MHKFKKKESIVVEEIEDEVIIYDPETKAIHHLNPMAGIILDLYDIYQNPEEIAKEIADKLKSDRTLVQKDVQRILSQFKGKGLLV
jgi:hypothetical protein